ncbi:nuclear transport factor 2 family protein [Taklimakanibacter deserti]|uniref:nuclear transport factor 2 family protein n=1 Tax=Taklimakanibacter deserti TaxID=2267839 RepID=UPI000E65DBCF
MALRETWAAYEEAWSESDPGRRATILRLTLDATFVYSDPVTRTESQDALSRYIGELQQTVPGLRIVTTSFAEHHDACLVGWTLQDGNSNAVARGVTCGERDGNGLLKKATVFYDLPHGSP